jgi:hypothetical protein
MTLKRATIATGKVLKAVFLYIVFFRWVIDIVHWLLDVGGTIAVSAFLLGTTYVIINLVAHQLLLWVVFGHTNVIDTLNQIAMITFSVLPELIVISAIKQCYEMWVLSFGSRRIECFVWSVLFTMPTLVFMAMTYVTISGFVSLESVHQTYQLTGSNLQLRVVSGLFYGVTQKLYTEIGRGTLDRMFTDLRHQLQNATTTLTDRDTTIANLQTTITTLQSDMAGIQGELVGLRIAQAQRNTHTRQKPAPTEHKTSGETRENTETHTHEGAEQPANGRRQRLKELMEQAVLSGKPVNIKQLSKAAGLSYNTGLRHKTTIMNEITNEHSAIQLVKEA